MIRNYQKSTVLCDVTLLTVNVPLRRDLYHPKNSHRQENLWRTHFGMMGLFHHFGRAGERPEITTVWPSSNIKEFAAVTDTVFVSMGGL